jgi:hypothetical protein
MADTQPKNEEEIMAHDEEDEEDNEEVCVKDSNVWHVRDLTSYA